MLAAIMMMVLAAPCHAQYRVKRDSNERTEIKNYTREQLDSIYSSRPPLGISYTRRHPLVVASAWAFPPYSFMDDSGEPDGLFLELMNSIFQQFHVANEIQMMDRAVARRLFLEKKVDLLVDIENMEMPDDVYSSRMVVAEFMVSVMYKKGTDMLRSITLINPGDTVAVNSDDYTYSYIRESYDDNVPGNIIPVKLSTVVNDLFDGNVKYLLGRTAILRNLVNRYGIEDEVEIQPIDVPNGRFRFFSRDTLLLHEIDLRMQNMENTGQLHDMRERWFSGKGHAKIYGNINEIAAVVALILIIVVMVIAFIIMRRTSIYRGLKREFREITSMGLSLSQCHAVIISIRKRKVYGVVGDMVPCRGISFDQYIDMIHPDDLAIHRDVMAKVDSGTVNMPTIRMRLHSYGDTTGEWRSMAINAKIKTDSKGRPLHLFLTFIDETENINEIETLDKVTREDKSVADLSDVGMAYYDQHGCLDTANNAYIDFFGNGDRHRGQEFVSSKSLRELCVILNGIVLEQDMNAWFCAPVDILELNLKTVIEVRIHTIWGARHQNEGYTVTLHAMDEIRSVRRSLYETDRTLFHTQRSLQMFQSELRFIMRRRNIHVFRWRAGSDTLELSDNGLSFDNRVSLDEYLKKIIGDEDEVAQIRQAYSDYQNHDWQPAHMVRHLKGSDEGSPEVWYDISIRPENDEEGRFTGIFGICCDITDFMTKRNSLNDETDKANDAGRQKAAFMAEMTHELRTPLNVINGFAEIMSFLTTDEEKKQYVDIMSHSCTMLISLVDNILQLSIIDTEGLKLRPREVDFAQLFRQKAEELRRLITEPGVAYKVDCPRRSLMVTVDADRVLQVFDAFVNNASKFTKQGFIHVGFRFSEHVLTVYCRDTGCGIPQDKQRDVFKRFVKLDNFVQGTGLGLAVCQKIADAMDGSIDLYSREGEGTVISFNVNI